MKQFLKNARQALLETYDFIMEALRWVHIVCCLWLFVFYNGLIILYGYYYLMNFLFSFVPINAVTKCLFVTILAFTAFTALIFICVYLEDLNYFIIDELNKHQPTTKLGRKILKIIRKYW
jgi:hypothetical protein